MKIGIDIGGSNIRIGLYKNNVLQSYLKINSRFLNENNSRSIFINKVKTFIDENTSSNKIKYIAIAIPGTIAKDNKSIISAPNLRALNNWAIKEDLEVALNIKVYIFKDVNTLLAYDMNLNKITDDSVTAFYLGTGLGNAIYINNQIITGSNNSAGELGHIPLQKSTSPCNCGSFYCAENQVSGLRLEKIAHELKISDISLIFSKKHKLLDEFINDFARVIAIEVNIIDPTYIIISGGVTNMKDFPKIKLLDNISLYLRRPLKIKDYTIIFSENTKDQGPLGAIICAAMVRKEYYE